MSDVSVQAGPSTMISCDFQHHTLCFRYPAFELLPPGKQPFLEMPKGVPDREEPEITPMGLSAEDLDFFIRFPSEYGAPLNGATSKREQAILKGPLALNLSAAIDSLSSFAGISDLYFVSYVEDWDVITRFELRSTFYTNFGKLDDQAQEFELGSADVAKLIRTMSKDDEWVRMLDDLIHVKSDRAYLCRRREIFDWDEQWLEANEENWPTSWDINDLDSAKQLFANRLISVYQMPEGTIGREKLGKLAEFKDEAHYVQLPCGHRSMMPENYVHDLSGLDALDAVCDECERRVLQKGDIERLGYYYDRVRRYNWEDRVSDWVPKCKKVRNDASVVEISSAALSDSLLKALNTFDIPSSINPPSLCPSSYPESHALLTKLTDTLKQHASLPAMTPRSLLSNLENLAWRLTQEMVGDATLMAVILPPGFDDFVTRWMTRAVNDAVGNQADEEQDTDMMEIMTKMGRSNIDPTAAALEDDFDSMLKSIGETRLEAEGGDDQGPGEEDEDEEL